MATRSWSADPPGGAGQTLKVETILLSRAAFSHLPAHGEAFTFDHLALLHRDGEQIM